MLRKIYLEHERARGREMTPSLDLGKEGITLADAGFLVWSWKSRDDGAVQKKKGWSDSSLVHKNGTRNIGAKGERSNGGESIGTCERNYGQHQPTYVHYPPMSKLSPGPSASSPGPSSEGTRTLIRQLQQTGSKQQAEQLDVINARWAGNVGWKLG